MASPWPGRGSGAGACPSSTRGRGGHLQTHQDQAHEVPRRRSVSCNEEERGVCAGWGWVGELSRGERLGGGGSRCLATGQGVRSVWRSVWRHLTHSLTLPSYALRPGAWVHYSSGPHAVHRCLVLRSLLLFSLSLMMMDGSRAISLSPEKRPPRTNWIFPYRNVLGQGCDNQGRP